MSLTGTIVQLLWGNSRNLAPYFLLLYRLPETRIHEVIRQGHGVQGPVDKFMMVVLRQEPFKVTV